MVLNLPNAGKVVSSQPFGTHSPVVALDIGILLGLATEVQKLSFPEKCRVIDIVSEELAGRLPFSVTISGNSVPEQILLAEYAEQARAEWLILQPPAAGSYSANNYIDFFARVCDAVTLPMAIQNAREYLGRPLSVDDIEYLRGRCENLVAVKSEDSALEFARLVRAAPGLEIFGGRGGLEMIDCLRAGARGFILAPDIIVPAIRILGDWQRGDEQKALDLYARALPAIVFTMQSLEHLCCYGKRMFAANAELPVFDRAPHLIPSVEGLAAAEHWRQYLRSGLML